MTPRIGWTLALLLLSELALGQAKIRKLAPTINHVGFNNYAPFISLDGSTLIYLSDVAEDNALTLNYTVKSGPDWNDPVTLPKSINHHLNYIRGFGLGPDGKSIYISNPKSNGVGGYDLYVSRLNGNTWSEPENLTLPVNTKSNEACPSLTADGSLLFFMRCEKMDANKASACSLWMATKKPNGQWGDPQALPSFINTGNSQTPRIMGDSETLIFSSDKISPNKGGMDLYLTHWSGGKWSSPVPLDFANTAADDQFVSANALGMYLLRDSKGTKYQELIEVLFAPETKPKATMRVEGNVSTTGGAAAFITLFNLKDQSRVASVQPGSDGKFILYVPAGNRYELSIDPDKDNFTYYSKVYDLSGERIPQIDRVSAQLKPLATGDELTLEALRFKKGSVELEEDDAQELRRLTRLIQGNPSRSFSVELTLYGYVIDSVRSDPDLTETLSDTLKIPVSYEVDSVTTATRDSLVIRTRYHNDRTLQQAQQITSYLLKQGIPPGKIAASGKALPEAIPENRKTLVKLVIH